MKRNVISLLIIGAVCLGAVIGPAAALPSSRVERWRAVPVPAGTNEAAEAFLARPVGLALGADRLFITDAVDCAVKVFTKDGRFEAALGRKGRGPGEFSFPSGVSFRDGRLYVADKFNHRVQVLDGKGSPLGGFPLSYPPDGILALAHDRILVSRNPSGRPGNFPLLHIYDEDGGLVWEGLEAPSSGDPVYDTFVNMILVSRGPGTDFYVVHRSQDRTARRFDDTGREKPPVPIDERYVFKNLNLPVRGSQKTLKGFCWASAADESRLFLLAPEDKGGEDLGPGREVFVFDNRGGLESILEFPVRLALFVVEADRVYALDADEELRIFRIER
jgi:hypothetical protein